MASPGGLWSAFENGAYRTEARAEERVTAGEIKAAVRNAGIGRLEAVAAVVLETDGSMSVTTRTANERLPTLDWVRR